MVLLPQRRDTSKVGGVRVMLDTDEHVIPQGWPSCPNDVTIATPVGKVAISERTLTAIVFRATLPISLSTRIAEAQAETIQRSDLRTRPAVVIFKQFGQQLWPCTEFR
jgi:hypothetical protein